MDSPAGERIYLDLVKLQHNCLIIKQRMIVLLASLQYGTLHANKNIPHQLR